MKIEMLLSQKRQFQWVRYVAKTKLERRQQFFLQVWHIIAKHLQRAECIV